jgi:uncharacterized protein YkwD
VARLTAALLLALLVLAGCGGGAGPVRTEVVTIEQDGGAPTEGAAQAEPPSVPGGAECEPVTQRAAEGLEAADAAIVCLINAARAEEGLPALERSGALDRAARERSQEMADRDYFAHESPTGRDAQEVAREAGWVPEDRSWRIGENIGWGTTGASTPAHLVRGWLDSPSHRRNIMGERWTQIGQGTVGDAPQADTEGVTSTTLFGARGADAR